MMYNYLSGKLTWLVSVVLVGSLGLLSNVALADTFVSYNGKFNFTYPETWAQVDYTTAEYYLTHGDEKVEVDFEAVFSEKQTRVIFHGQYLILTVDTVGSMTSEKVDSVLKDLSNEFNRPIKEVSPEDFLSGSLVDTIAFDRTNNLVGIESEVAGDETGPRVNLLVMKLYEYGIANFYFYAPKVEFVPSLPIFRDMVMSFSTETIKNTSPEEVKVADLEDKDSNTGLPIAVLCGLVVVLIAVIARRKRSRANKQ